MKFKNIETGTILEVPKDNEERIKKFRGYPDKFVEIGEMLSDKPKKEKELEKQNESKELEKEELDNKNDKKKN